MYYIHGFYYAILIQNAGSIQILDHFCLKHKFADYQGVYWNLFEPVPFKVGS